MGHLKYLKKDARLAFLSRNGIWGRVILCCGAALSL